MMQYDCHEALKKIHPKLNNLSNISLEDFLLIEPIVKIQEVKAGDFFLKAGSSSAHVALILKGITKTYYITENGKEHITHFGIEGSFTGVYTQMLKKEPCTGDVKALERSILLVMNYYELIDVTKTNLQWAHLLRRIAEERYVFRSEKERNITLKTAQERYEYFIEKHPQLFARLPQQEIALYLNITPATLSRLKNGTGKYKK